MNTKRAAHWVAEVDKTLDALEQGRYAPHKISWACDRIAWLAKWGHIDNLETERLTNRAIEVMNLPWVDNF